MVPAAHEGLPFVCLSFAFRLPFKVKLIGEWKHGTSRWDGHGVIVVNGWLDGHDVLRIPRNALQSRHTQPPFSFHAITTHAPTVCHPFHAISTHAPPIIVATHDAAHALTDTHHSHTRQVFFEEPVMEVADVCHGCGVAILKSSDYRLCEYFQRRFCRGCHTKSKVRC